MAWDDAPPPAWDAAPPDAQSQAAPTGQPTGMQMLSLAGKLTPLALQQPIDAFRKYMASGNQPAPNTNATTGEGFERSSAYPNSMATDPTVSDAMNVYSAYKAPAAIGAIGSTISGAISSGAGAIKNGLSWISDIYQAAPKAEAGIEAAKGAIGTVDSAAVSGGTIRQGLFSEKAAMGATSDSLYTAAKGTPIPLTNLSSASKEILSVNDALPTGFEISPKLTKMASTLQSNGFTVSADAAINMRSQLGDIMTNGDGADRVFAGKMWKAITQDIQTTNPANSQAFNIATNYYKDMQGLLQNPLIKKLSTAPIEDLPDVMFNSGRVNDVLTARAAVGEEGFKAAKQAYANDLLQSPNLTKLLAKKSPEYWQSIYNPDELKTLQAVAPLIDAARTVKQGSLGLKLVGGIGATEVLVQWAMHKMFR